MLTFNPGPSQISDATKQDILDITQSGLLSVSHRAKPVIDMVKSSIELLREKFSVPNNFKIVYHHSATGAMETILRNCVNKKSGHIVHGAFSERMHKTAQELGLETESETVEWGEIVSVDALNFSENVELISVTHNETSTGLKWPKVALKQLREKYPDNLISWDMTSSFGAVEIDWNLTDIVFCSVQKCLGLPSGLGLIFIKDDAINNLKNNQIPAWQNLEVMIDKIESYQTVETPNIFALALLEKQLSRMDLKQILNDTNLKYDFILSQNYWKPFVKNLNWNSKTVLNLDFEEPQELVKQLMRENIVVGTGYGKLKNSCIRIANFPSITMEHLERLMTFLK